MKSNSFFKGVLFLGIAYFYIQVQAAEGLSLSNGQSEESQGFSVEADAYFKLLLDREQAQDTLMGLLGIKKDLKVTNRLEQAAEGLKISDDHYIQEDSDLERQIVLVEQQIAAFGAQIESSKAERKKAEDERKEQEAKDKEKALGGTVKPLVAVWQGKHKKTFV